MDRDIIIYAFRYALGRKTYASLIMSDYILKHWDDFSEQDIALFKREVTDAIFTKRAGMDCDIAQWQRIIDKGVK